MNDMNTFVLISTVVAVAAIAIGVIFPAIAMGKAIATALDALSRQPEAAVADLQACQRMLVTYFDMSARRTQIAADMLRQVSSQSRLVGIPRPDDTLAATTAALAGR